MTAVRETLRTLKEGHFYQCYSDPQESKRRVWREAPHQCLYIVRQKGLIRYQVVVLDDGGTLRRTNVQFLDGGFWEELPNGDLLVCGFFEPVDVTSDYEIRRFRAAGVRFWSHSHPPIRNLRQKEA